MDLIKTIDENEEVENLSEDSDAEIEVPKTKVKLKFESTFVMFLIFLF